MTIDDVESLLESLLAALKARKQIAPLQQKISALVSTNATLTSERDELRKKVATLQTQTYKHADELELSRQQLTDAQKKFADEREDFQRQLNEQQAKFDWEMSQAYRELSDAHEKFHRELRENQADFDREMSAVCTELDEAKKLSRQQLADAHKDFDRQLAEQRGEFERKLADANKNLSDARADFERQLNVQRNDYERQLTDMYNEIDDVREEQRAAKREADFFRTTYGELDAAYKIYSSLDETTRFDLAGIFGAGDTAAGFFSGAVQESHLPHFWDYVSRHTDDLRLGKLFDFCFVAVNRGFREPPYIRLKVERGNFFDDETMRRTSRSRQSGRVNRVLLRGYRYSSGNVVRQSVVELA